MTLVQSIDVLDSVEKKECKVTQSLVQMQSMQIDKVFRFLYHEMV